MRIGIDATGVWGMNEGSPSGIVNYTIQITRNLVNLDDHNEYYIYCRNGVPSQFEDLVSRVSLKVLKSRNRKLLQQTRLPLAALSDRLDLMFFPFNSASLLCPGKSIVTIHDLHPFTVPERFAIVHGVHVHKNSLGSAINKWYWKNILRLSSRRASRIVAVSGVTKRDIETIFHVPGKKIDVVHEGVDLAGFSLDGDAKDAASFREGYHLPQRYILCMGTHGYKNVEGSIKSFHIVKTRGHDSLKLVIAGNKRSLGEDKFQLIKELNLEADVIFTDYFPDEDLKYLYQNAELLLFPSFYEGFGLPLMEAFACGTPVVTSTAGAIPEVAGDAALLVDPADPEEIASAVLTMLTDKDLREKLRQRGWWRAQEFSWEQVARKTLEVFENVH